MKHCVDGVARLMLKYFSFFIGVAGFKKNSNGYIEEIGNLHVSMRFYRHVSAFSFLGVSRPGTGIWVC